MSGTYFIGCDVGTGSARIGIFNQVGEMVAMHSHTIKIWRPRPNFVEQSSDDIWDACCRSIKEVLNKSDIRPKQVKGVGFDATCSLVALGEYDKPIPVSPDGPDHQNVMVWMDHRASKEADEINNTNHEVLRYVGGTISPEMEPPKLLWLKRNNPDTWNKAIRFFDLADYLVYRATGTDVRSVCTKTCKWTYLAHEDPVSEDNVGRWDNSYFHGNRSPRADPSLLGSICGLRLSNTIEDLALKYLATIQAIAYGTRHIIETMNNNGYSIAKIMATGGGTKNDLFLKEHADICRCDIILPREREAVLLGGAVLGSVASGHYTSVTKAMVEMNHAGRKITPDNNGVQAYHDAKYEVFLKMYDDEISYFNIMDQKLQKA
ncbi:FGGY-family carbohydrate kinase [Halalkalibaculum sp. DA384]|uniref:FGGY-family carbohydrate kinase n=1 Tax=Halalkalibaculum sp. DA384 TaxID=3373606 RepID=UPI003754500A